MISSLQDWIANKIRVGGFASRRDVIAFAGSNTVWTTITAALLNYAVYEVFGAIGFLGITGPASPFGDLAVTICVAGPIAFLAYYLVGDAIYRLSLSRNEFERLSLTDPLTGIMNRRAFVEAIETMDGSFAMAIFDVDRFKLVNDTYGHGAGDKVLVGVARMLTEQFGDDNIVGRLGGEEFGLVLKGCCKPRAIAAVEKFVSNLARQTFDVDGVTIGVTISAGLVQCNGRKSYSTLLSDADKALYFAKTSGRNRVIHAEALDALIPGHGAARGRIAS